MKLYHWFIPNKRNNFHPTALRTSGLVIFLIIFSLLPLTYNVTTAKQVRVLGYATSISISDLNIISNQQRTNAGLAPLNLSPTLSSAAYAKAQDMFADNYWAHIAPDGTTPWSFILAAGYNYSEAGENLAKNFNTSIGVVNGWMNSPAHAANVLKTSYTDAGYAVVNGTLLGEETTLVVAMYGMPSVSAPVVSATPSQPSPKSTTPNNSQPTPDPTPTPTPVPALTQNADETKTSIQTEPVVTAKTPTDNTATKDTGIVDGIMSALPIQLYSSFNWGQKASLLLLCALFLLFTMKHTIIWRNQKRGLKHIWLRAHPIGQIVILVAAIVVTLTSSVGVIL